jgi:ligand-binding sensor domain-containing protein
MKRLIFILLLCSVSSTWVAKAQIPVFTEKYSVLSGLSQDAILDMVKDESGFIWFASRDGLSRFDGNSFLNFKVQSKELKRSVSNQFHSIITDQNGCFWILNDITSRFINNFIILISPLKFCIVVCIERWYYSVAIFLFAIFLCVIRSVYT